MPKVIHFQIFADDIERAKKFYTSVFDWKMEKISLNNVDHYFIFSKDYEQESFGHITKREQKINCIVDYIGVSSIEESFKKIDENNGTVMIPKTAINGYGWYALCRDSEGNIFGLWEEKKVITDIQKKSQINTQS